MQGVDKVALTTQVDALQPVGWTPLGYALQQAANDFTQPASEGVVNAIIMVTDGLETCGADPAAIAAELKSSPAGITTHVIGFGTTPDELAILQGITQASGGQLLGSTNAGQLMSSLFTILEELEVVEETGTGEARNSPLGIGRIGQVGDYEVSVISVTPYATDIVMAENQFNEPPAEGNQFFMARVATTYVGAATGTPWVDLSFQAVGNKSASYTTFNNTCGVYPDDGFTIAELFEGGSAEFNVCWEIDSTDEDSLVMYVEPSFSFDSDPVWFSLDENYVASAPTNNAAPTQADSSTEMTDAVGAIGGEVPSNPVALSVSMVDIAYEETELSIPANTDVELTAVNNGVLQHDFVIDNPAINSGMVDPGASATITLNLPPGTYEFYCSVPGHKEAGMVGTLIVE